MALELYGSSQQGQYGDVKTKRPGLGSGFAAKYKWDSWKDHEGWDITRAREKFINLAEPLLIEKGIDMRDPLEPGPDYYEGCYAEDVEEGVDDDGDSETT